jgi:hypothetical protein
MAMFADKSGYTAEHISRAAALALALALTPHNFLLPTASEVTNYHLTRQPLGDYPLH